MNYEKKRKCDGYGGSSQMSNVYAGNDLGITYDKSKTSFRLWAPTASEVKLCLYKDGQTGDCYQTIDLEKSENGTWTTTQSGDLNGVYYTFMVTVSEITRETQDPYSIATGVNGKRSMVVDLSTTNPAGFEKDHGPKGMPISDYVISEFSVRDTTADPEINAKYPGQYLGMTETGLTNKDGLAAGLDHYKNLGVTHLQLMPSYDFGSVDESKPDDEQYNWGYDPINYNVPEGSYSSDPFHGEVRIKEFKEMVKAIHDNGMGIIMDVVYNHTYNVEDNCLYKTAPDLFYRKDGEKYSDASACGNEIASDQPMVRKYIIDSLKYWTSEYHIDGFRFDLMGVLDIETMNLAYEALKEVNPDIVLYGEPWAGGDSVLAEEKRALKKNVSKLKGVSVFSDDIRDAVKGHVFYEEVPGFINGGTNMENDIRFCVVGAVEHPQVDYEKYSYTPEGAWAKNPVDSINYVSCHDNLTLWDKNEVLNPNATEEQMLQMNRLAASIVFTSQGVPFFLTGEEFGREKPVAGESKKAENSYNLPIETNMLRYENLTKRQSLVSFYRDLISLRKNHKAFRLQTKEEVCKQISFMDVDTDNVVAYTISGVEETLFVAYNANWEQVKLSIPDGEWKAIFSDDTINENGIFTTKKQAFVEPKACLILKKIENN